MIRFLICNLWISCIIGILLVVKKLFKKITIKKALYRKCTELYNIEYKISIIQQPESQLQQLLPQVLQLVSRQSQELQPHFS